MVCDRFFYRNCLGATPPVTVVMDGYFIRQLAIKMISPRYVQAYPLVGVDSISWYTTTCVQRSLENWYVKIENQVSSMDIDAMRNLRTIDCKHDDVLDDDHLYQASLSCIQETLTANPGFYLASLNKDGFFDNLVNTYPVPLITISGSDVKLVPPTSEQRKLFQDVKARRFRIRNEIGKKNKAGLVKQLRDELNAKANKKEESEGNLMAEVKKKKKKKRHVMIRRNIIWKPFKLFYLLHSAGRN